MTNNIALEPLTQAEESKVHLPDQLWSDSFAAKVAKQDFESAEMWRATNHDHRWENAENLYHAWVDKKTWEGTKIPRASLGVFIAFEQIESLLPRYMSTIFGGSPWAEAEPGPGVDPEQTRVVRDVVLSQWDDMSGREHCRRAFKSALLYGNGIVEAGWRHRTVSRTSFVPEYRPKMQVVNHPLFGAMQVPVGVERITRRVNQQFEINEPFVNQVSLKDFYIDPNCPTPIVQDARFACRRAFKTVDELLAFKNEDGFNIPPRETLLEMARWKPSARSDTSKSNTDAIRAISWQPHEDTSKDPGAGRIEVVNYWTAARTVWLLNREWVSYNRPNQYGVIPYFDAFYTDVLDRFYGLAVTDVVEYDQRLIQELINARLDELSLGINRTRVKRQGVSQPAYTMRKRPGQTLEFEHPGEDYKEIDTANVTQNTFIEVQAAELRVQKATGVTDLAVLGTPSAGGNSAARTATGINAQTSAAGSRHIYLIENSEYLFIEPLLNFILKADQEYLDPTQAVPFKDQQGQQQQADPLAVKNSGGVKIKMRSAARERSKTSLAQSLPLIMQALLNPGIMQEMGKIGMKLNVRELDRMIMDAMDQKQRDALWVEMSPEERQALNQPPPQEIMSLQKQRERLTAQGEHLEFSKMSDIIREIVRETIKSQQETGENRKGVM